MAETRINFDIDQRVLIRLCVVLSRPDLNHVIMSRMIGLLAGAV